MTDVEQQVVLAPGDGSLGPLLRVADDRLGPGCSYGWHEHRAVDVVAVVLAGELQHVVDGRSRVGEGDVGVLRAGSGLRHDEVAGPAGARVLQHYLRSADPQADPSHEVHAAPVGWVDLRRPDADVWIARLPAGQPVVLPPGLLLLIDDGGVSVAAQDGGPLRSPSPATAVVWRLDDSRPSWARD